MKDKKPNHSIDCYCQYCVEPLDEEDCEEDYKEEDDDEEDYEDDDECECDDCMGIYDEGDDLGDDEDG